MRAVGDVVARGGEWAFAESMGKADHSQQVYSTRVPVANLELVKEKDAVVARNTLLRTEWMPDLIFCRKARCKHCKIVLNRRIKLDDQQNRSDNNSHNDAGDGPPILSHLKTRCVQWSA